MRRRRWGSCGRSLNRSEPGERQGIKYKLIAYCGADSSHIPAEILLDEDGHVQNQQDGLFDQIEKGIATAQVKIFFERVVVNSPQIVYNGCRRAGRIASRQPGGQIRMCLQITDTSLKLFSLYFRAFL